MSYLPLSVIVTSFRKDCVKRPLEGFGVLVPSKEQRNGLKTLGEFLIFTNASGLLDYFRIVNYY